MKSRHLAGLALIVLVAGACSSGGGSSAGSSSTAPARITAVTGSACGYFTNVGLFGGPQMRRGCGQAGDAPATGASAEVTLPESGSDTPVTAVDNDGAAAQYGPATIFGGIWPADVNSPPPSGPISVATHGSAAAGSVSSSTDIVLRDPADPKSPGGIGPPPVEADEVHVSCNADASVASGTTTFKNGKLSTSTDAEGNPKDTEAIPDSPPVDYTRSGVITNVGDVFSVVFNEQVVGSDGSLTVNGVHMYLFGPTAVGEVVKGQVKCGTTPSAAKAADTVAPRCGTLVVEPNGPQDPTPKSPRTELVGVFDAGGLKSITDIQSRNGTVQVGDPSGAPYLQLTPGQTGPLPVTATRTDESQPMSWSFVATDQAGNTTKCPSQ